RERHNVTSLPPQPSAHTPAEAPRLSRGTPAARGTAGVPSQAGARRPWLALVALMLPGLRVSVANTVRAFSVTQPSAPLGTPAALGTAGVPSQAGARRPWLALVVLMLPVLLVSVDNTVLAFAVPQLSAQLQPTSAQLLWIVDVYPLILAALLVPMGSAADR